MKKPKLLILSALLLAVAQAWATLPATLNYQGRMTTSAGGAVPDSTGNTVTFRIFDASTAGTELWAEVYSTAMARFVTTKSGLFSVTLGQYTPINLPFDVPYYLQVEWYNGAAYETLLPRQPLTMAPYAYRAKYLDAPLSLSGNFPSPIVLGSNNLATGVEGDSNGGTGVYGTSGSGIGVWGWSNTGEAVFAKNSSSVFPALLANNLANFDAIQATTTGVVNSTDAISGVNSGFGAGVHGDSVNGDGVYGDGATTGVFGTSSSGDGVYGVSTFGNGVYGSTDTSGGVGVYAENTGGGLALQVFGNAQFGFGSTVDFSGATVVGLPGLTAPLSFSGNFPGPVILGSNGLATGVEGDSAGGTGVYGGSDSGTGVWGSSNSGLGVYAQSNAPSTPAMQADNTSNYDAIIATTSGIAVDNSTAAISGVNSGLGDGVYGDGAATGVFGVSDTGDGVNGQANGGGDGVYGSAYSGRGVYGQSTFGTGGFFTGNSEGVHGESSAPGGYGVYGVNYGSGESNQFGVYGIANSSFGGIGVYGNGSLYGIQGTAGSQNAIAVFGSNWNDFNIASAVYGFNPGLNNTGNAVEGYNTSAGGVGVLANNDGGGDAIQAYTSGGSGTGVDAIYAVDDSYSEGGTGVRGNSTLGYGGYFDGGYAGVIAHGGTYGIQADGSSFGIYARSNGPAGIGVLAENTDAAADNYNAGAGLWVRGRIAVSPYGGGGTITQYDNTGSLTFIMPTPQSSGQISFMSGKPSTNSYTVTIGSGGAWINNRTIALVTIYNMTAGYTYSVSTTQDNFIINFSNIYSFNGTEYVNFVLINQQ